MARLFVAVRPDEVARRAIGEVLGAPRLEPGVRWVPPEQWHITLRFWAEADPDAVMGALGALRPPGGSVTAVLGPAVSRLGRSAVVIPAAGVDALADAVRAATAEVGPPPDPRPFAGHLTVARLRHRAACGVAGGRISVSFGVTEVELVHSELTAAGAVHTVVERWRV